MPNTLDPSGTLRVAVILRCGPNDPITCEDAITAEDVTHAEALGIVASLRKLNPCVTFSHEWTDSRFERV